MRLRSLVLILMLSVAAAIAAISAAGQTVILSGSNTKTASNKTFTGKLCMVPTGNKGAVLMSWQYGGGGQGVSKEVCFEVIAGAIQSGATLPDTYLTNPQNICFYSRMIDPTQRPEKSVVGILPCLQPASSGQNWCTTAGGITTCDLDNYIPSQIPFVVQEPDVMGPTGPSGGLPGATDISTLSGADFGAKLAACIGALNATYGGICEGRNMGSQALAMASTLTISQANTVINLPCSTITTAQPIIVTAGTRNVSIHGCGFQGASTASGTQGATVWVYTGTGTAIQVGDTTYAADTKGFHLDNVNLNTASAGASAIGIAFYRTQEIDLRSLYLNGNQLTGQVGFYLDGTGDYSGGSFDANTLNGFGAGIYMTGHISGSAVDDYSNAATFTRLHIVCPTSSGNPVSGTYGVNLVGGDGNTWSGGDIEGCSTMFHFGAHATSNTVTGLRNENSTIQYQADSGSTYNAVFSGGTLFTGDLVDNGNRNSFWDAFHHTVNGMNGDWYASQQDATVTDHVRVGTGLGNERGRITEYQTDFGYRWEVGPGDGTSGEQIYSVYDVLSAVQRLSIGQYLSATADSVTNVVVNNGGCYNSSTPAVVAFSGGAGSSAAGTAVMGTISSLSCSGYTVESVTMTNNGTGYTSAPTVSFSGSNQTTTPNAVAEVTPAGSTNNQSVLNATGTGAVVLNGANNAGTGGVVIGSGGVTETTVATVDSSGDAFFNGTLQGNGQLTWANTIEIKNNANAENDFVLWAGTSAAQNESFIYKNYAGTSEWYMVNKTTNDWALNEAASSIDSFKAYNSANTGDTYVNAQSSSGIVRLNYETGSGTAVKIYGGSSSAIYAAFTGVALIQFPGLAAGTGHYCLQIDTSGYVTNTGAVCASGAGTGTVTSVTLTVPSDEAVSGSPITTSGTLAVTRNTQTAGLFLASPCTGSAASPVYRAICAADIAPAIPASACNLSSNSSSTLTANTCTGTGNTVLAVAPTLTGNTTTLANNTTATDYLIIEPGTSSTAEIGALEWASATGTSEWEARDDATYNFHLRNAGATTPADILVGYSGAQTVINSQGTASVAINNTSTGGTGGFIVYEGGTNYSVAALTVAGSGAASLVGTLGTGGTITSGGSLTALSGQLIVGAADPMFFNGRAKIYSPADSVIQLTNNAMQAFGALELGGTAPGTTLAISTSTAPTNPSGSTWTYTLNATQTAAGSNGWAGASMTITGYTSGATGNNGTFIVTASTSTTVSVTNVSGTTTTTGTPVFTIAAAAFQTTGGNSLILGVGASGGTANLTVTGAMQSNTLGSSGTVSVSGCSLSSAVGGGSVGQFASGTSGTCTVTITPGSTAAHGFFCKANDLTTNADTLIQTASSTTTCTIAGTTVSGDTINFEALSY